MAQEKNKSFVVILSQEFVRDTQMALTPDVSWYDEDQWSDVKCPVVMSVQEGSSEKEALDRVADREGIKSEMLYAYEIVSS